jgi:hypothetical protein
VKLGARRQLPAACDLPKLQAALARFILGFQLINRGLNAFTVFTEYIGDQFYRDRLFAHEDKSFDHCY